MSKTANPASVAPLTREELVRSLVAGERRFHEIPKHLTAEEAAAIRRQALEEMTSTPLSNIGHHSLDVHRASHRNCENFIGVAQIPMGVVGPLKVRGKLPHGDYRAVARGVDASQNKERPTHRRNVIRFAVR